MLEHNFYRLFLPSNQASKH